MKTKSVVACCKKCRIVVEFLVPEEELSARRKGASINDAFKSLSPEKQRLLAEGLCEECQKG